MTDAKTRNASVSIVVRGTRFYEATKLIAANELRVGTIVRLNPNPNNRYDSNAVEVRAVATNAMLGHIPKEIATKYGQLVRDGQIHGVTVKEVTTKRQGPYVKIQVRLTQEYSPGENKKSILSRSIAKLPKVAGVYKLICHKTGRYYIGSSIDLKQRGIDHSRMLRHHEHHNVLMQDDFDHYGADEFDMTVLCLCGCEREALAREQQEIDQAIAQGASLYNMTEDGQGMVDHGQDNNSPLPITDRDSMFESDPKATESKLSGQNYRLEAYKLAQEIYGPIDLYTGRGKPGWAALAGVGLAATVNPLLGIGILGYAAYRGDSNTTVKKSRDAEFMKLIRLIEKDLQKGAYDPAKYHDVAFYQVAQLRLVQEGQPLITKRRINKRMQRLKESYPKGLRISDGKIYRLK